MNIIYVDIANGYPSGGLSDGAHPNQKGYDYMGKVFYEAIEQYLGGSPSDGNSSSGSVSLDGNKLYESNR